METREGARFLCGMPPGDGPWRLKSYQGKVWANSPSAGLFWLEIVAHSDLTWAAQWNQIKLSDDGTLAASVYDAPTF